MKDYYLEDALHDQSPMEIGLFPCKLDWSTTRKAEFSDWVSGLKFCTVSPRFVVGTKDGSGTILVDVSYENTGSVIISYYADDFYDQWRQLLHRKAGSLPCDRSITAKIDEKAVNTFDQELFAWIKEGCPQDYDFRFRL